ncbi:hypothetical protein D3C75_571540 [compost metagenome]
MLIRCHGIIIRRQLIRYFDQVINGVLLSRIFLEHRKQILFTEITGMIDDDVLNNLQPLGMCGVDQILIGSTSRFIPWIYFGEIDSMVAMIIITARILHYRCNPDGTEPEGFDVIELLNQPFKIPSPRRVGVWISRFGIIPGVYVVARIPIIKPGSNYEVNGVLPEIARLSNVVYKALCGLIPHSVYYKKFQCRSLGDKNRGSGQASQSIARDIYLGACRWFRTIIRIICLSCCRLVVFDIKRYSNLGVGMPHRQIRRDGWGLQIGIQVNDIGERNYTSCMTK